MFGTIFSGMSTSMFEISVVSNNVANASTTAFRKSSASFSDLYSGASAETVSRTSTGTGSIIEQTRQNTKQGALMERDGVLNMALAGSGMFVTTTPNSDGTLSEALNFTRDGEFALDESGVLRSSTNDIVYGFDGTGGTTLQKIVIPFVNEADTKLTSIELWRTRPKSGWSACCCDFCKCIILATAWPGEFQNVPGLRSSKFWHRWLRRIWQCSGWEA
jgi:flagellar basal-body rod protein FlgG